MRILVVDDSNVIRSRITRIIKANKGLNIKVVGAATNGIVALDIALQTEPDVVTMDLTMPEMDGLESIQRLIAMYPKIKILVISALDDKSTAIKAIRLGACGFLAKPFSDEELLLALLDVADAD